MYNFYLHFLSSHVAIFIQQDATIYSLFISATCFTCFGLYFHPSSGAHNFVSTVSGITETDTATCLNVGVVVTVWIMLVTVDTVIWDPDDGWR